mmetsp:Transcript_10707/g.35855  ORF Transcript_10707/g.35855 Transcript_10707/m.35855 type:complete len:117 (+) Transcript_10707:185-535(+)
MKLIQHLFEEPQSMISHFKKDSTNEETTTRTFLKRCQFSQVIKYGMSLTPLFSCALNSSITSPLLALGLYGSPTISPAAPCDEFWESSVKLVCLPWSYSSVSSASSETSSTLGIDC